MDKVTGLRTLAGYCADATMEIWRDEMVNEWTPVSVRLVMILLTWIVGLFVAFKVIRGDLDGDVETMPMP